MQTEHVMVLILIFANDMHRSHYSTLHAHTYNRCAVTNVLQKACSVAHETNAVSVLLVTVIQGSVIQCWRQSVVCILLYRDDLSEVGRVPQ